MKKTSMFSDTGWSFVTSGGGEVDVNISAYAYGAASAGAFYVKKDFENQIWRLPFAAVGIGSGFGISAGGPITLQLAMPCGVGGGFRVYRNPMRRSAFGLSSFRGSFVMVTGGGSAALFGYGTSFLLFGAPSGIVNALRAAGPIGLGASVNAAVLACEGGGVLWGMSQSNAASISTTVYTGEIVSTQHADPHETGD